VKTVMPVKATLNELNKVIAKIHAGSIITLKGSALGEVKVAGSQIVQIVKDYVPETELIGLVGETPEIAELRARIAKLDEEAEAAAAAAYEQTKSYMKSLEATKPFSVQAGNLRKEIEELMKVDAAIERVVAETIGKVELEVDKDTIAWRQEVTRVKEQWGGDGTVILLPKEKHLDLAVQKDESKKVLTVVASLFLTNDKGAMKSLSAIGHEISELLGNPGINNGVNSCELWTGKFDEYKVVAQKAKPAPAKEEAPEPKSEDLPVAV
jgi:hypothetical protein